MHELTIKEADELWKNIRIIERWVIEQPPSEMKMKALFRIRDIKIAVQKVIGKME